MPVVQYITRNTKINGLKFKIFIYSEFGKDITAAKTKNRLTSLPHFSSDTLN